MANGYTVRMIIGVAEVPAISIPEGMIADITIQNLSANDLYWGAVGGLSITTGLRIAANGNADIPARLIAVSLIASAADSDVRIDVQFYKKGEK